jgi:hypothetical protein
MAKRGLMEQDLSKLDVTTLHPLSPEVISRQATINIGKREEDCAFGAFAGRGRRRTEFVVWWCARYNWSCGAREVDGGEGYLGRAGMMRRLFRFLWIGDGI